MATSGTDPLTVLLVEDDPAVRAFQAAALAAAGPFRVLTAPEGKAALEALRHLQVAAVVTDLHMPGMDGFQLVAELSTRYPGLPVFVLTGVGDLEALEHLLAGSALRIHAKPPEYPVLAEEIRELRRRPEGAARGISLPAFLQLLQWEGRTATVTVHAGSSLGRVYLDRGRLIQAEAGDLAGVEAALAMCAWPSPSLEFIEACLVEPAFSMTAEALQMELALRRDQAEA
ncbi:MAG TPA: response regulator [Holophagaceae bacterium]|nr:response regulator [Holophagaceae bacterium]